MTTSLFDSQIIKTGNLQGDSIEFYIQNLHTYIDLLREYPIIRKIIREFLSKSRDYYIKEFDFEGNTALYYKGVF